MQGVGFRATARDLAGAYALSGWVRNDAEGTVTLEAQGQSDEIERYIAELRTTLHRNIKGMTATDIGVINDEEGFRITR